jgi:hypothetical protein
MAECCIRKCIDFRAARQVGATIRTPSRVRHIHLLGAQFLLHSAVFAFRRREDEQVAMAMNASLSTNERVSALLSFLNARTSLPFASADIEALLQEPRVADSFGRVVDLALACNDCVLGVDELQTYFQSRPRSLSV